MSELYKLSLNDFWKGALVAVLVAVLMGLQTLLNDKGFGWSLNDLQAIIASGGSAFIAYILKNFATDSEGKVLGRF